MNKTALVLFSGGKDSFLTACGMVESGYGVVLFSCNNGVLAGEKNLLHGAARLANRYGPDKITYAGVYGTAGLMHRLTADWFSSPQSWMAKKYPDLTNTQILYTTCQTAMWTSAIAYAVAKGIRTAAADYRSTDYFCTGIPGYRERIDRLASDFNVRTVMPVWDTEHWGVPGNMTRDEEMASRGFEPKVLEPKCLLGHPAPPNSSSNDRDVARYYDEVLLPMLHDMIRTLVPHFRYARLGHEAMPVPKYPVPDGNGGIY